MIASATSLVGGKRLADYYRVCTIWHSGTFKMPPARIKRLAILPSTVKRCRPWQCRRFPLAARKISTLELMQVKAMKPTGAASQPPPIAVRPTVQPFCAPGFIAPAYGALGEGWPQFLQQPGGWSHSTAGQSFTFVPTPRSTPAPGPDQGSMPFSYPRRPVLPALCSAWQIPTEVRGPQLSEPAPDSLARCKSAPIQSPVVESLKSVETRRSSDTSFDLDSVLDSEPLYLGEDSDLFDYEFGDMFGTAETQQHDALEAAAKLEALVCPDKASASLPFGLQLKKSESFVNLINKELAETRASYSRPQGSG